MPNRLVKAIDRLIGSGRFKRLGKAASVSVLNQVVSSGVNFVLGLYLVRVLSHTDFGLYSIGFAISLFYAGIGNALFLTQMVVNFPDKPATRQSAYVASVGAADGAFCALTFLSALILLPVIAIVFPAINQYVGLGIAVAAASGAYHIKDLFTRYSYTARREIWALKINMIIALVLLVQLGVLHASGVSFTAAGVLWLYAISQLAGAVAGQLYAKLPFSEVRFDQIRADVKEAWEGARWAVPTNVLYTLRGQAHTIVTAALAGPMGVAFLNATRLLVTPAIFVMPALTQVVLPRLATARSQNKARVLSLGAQFTAAVLLVSVLYSVVLLVFLEPITQLVLGEKYEADVPMTLAWCVFVIVHVLCINGIMVAQVLKQFQSIFVLNVATVVIMVAAIYVLNRICGVPGVIYGMATGDIFLAVIAWRLIVKECRARGGADGE